MRLRVAWVTPWLLAVLLSALLAQESAAQDDNLLANGGFENGTEGWLAIGGELTVDDALVHGGSSAGVFATDSTSRHEAGYCLPVAPSSDYEFQGYGARPKGDAVFTLRLIVYWYGRSDCLGQKLWIIQSSIVPLDDQERWYELALSGRAPDAAGSAYLTIEVQESGASVYLDDFAVNGPPIPTETPTPEPSASASPKRTPVHNSTPTQTPTPVPTDGTLRNGGFEEADPEGRPSYWQNYGGELARTNAVHLEGQFAAAFSSHTNSTKWAYQLMPVQGGKAYVLSGYALKDDPAVAAAFLRLSWYATTDGSGQAIDSVDSTERLTCDSPEFRFLTTEAVVAPAAAASAKARLMLDPTDEAPGTVYFDAVTFEETAPPEPEPTPSSTATPRSADDAQTRTPPPPTLTPSVSTPTLSVPVSTPTPEQRAESTPTGSAVTSQPSPTGAAAGGGAHRATAALGSARTPVASVTAATATPAAAGAPAFVYRQRKSDQSVVDTATARGEGVGGGLSTQLLALATGVPVLAGAGAGVYYWRWRRARLR
jgi:hypothetical protein